MKSRPFRSQVAAYERRLIEEALRLTQGHQARAAALLGVRATTLCEKMKRLGIGRAREAATAGDAAALPAAPATPAADSGDWRVQLDALLRQVALPDDEVRRLQLLVEGLAARRARRYGDGGDDGAGG